MGWTPGEWFVCIWSVRENQTNISALCYNIWLHGEWKVPGGGSEGWTDPGETDRKFLVNVVLIVSPTLVPPKPVKPIPYRVSHEGILNKYNLLNLCWW